MALRMVALNRLPDNRWFARKVIPEDVRKEYQRLYGQKREAHLKLSAETPRHEAKARLGEWAAEVETRIATLRAQRNGEGQPLTKLNAIALAGRWYNWFIAQYENDPGPAKVWRELSDLFVWEVIGPEAPDSYEEDPRSDPHWDWAKEPEVREAVRPRVSSDQVREEIAKWGFVAKLPFVLGRIALAKFKLPVEPIECFVPVQLFLFEVGVVHRKCHLSSLPSCVVIGQGGSASRAVFGL
ncbi:hypothetical protein ACVWZL_006378 [Bradyrhizobium sp. GM2.4]